jgi:hypothetical protein
MPVVNEYENIIQLLINTYNTNEPTGDNIKELKYYLSIIYNQNILLAEVVHCLAIVPHIGRDSQSHACPCTFWRLNFPTRKTPG